MNKRQKGRQFEIWIRNWLVTEGYLVHLAGKKAVKIGDRVVFKGDDIFGLFDIIAVKDKSKVRLIQASLHGAKKKRGEEIMKYEWPLDIVSVELWIKAKNGVVNISELTESGFQETGKIIRGKLYEIKNDK